MVRGQPGYGVEWLAIPVAAGSEEPAKPVGSPTECISDPAAAEEGADGEDSNEQQGNVPSASCYKV